MKVFFPLFFLIFACVHSRLAYICLAGTFMFAVCCVLSHTELVVYLSRLVGLPLVARVPPLYQRARVTVFNATDARQRDNDSKWERWIVVTYLFLFCFFCIVAGRIFAVLAVVCICTIFATTRCDITKRLR